MKEVKINKDAPKAKFFLQNLFNMFFNKILVKFSKNGYDYIIETFKRVESIGPNKFCKYAWNDIDWVKIFNFIEFDLSTLNCNLINYWSTEHLNDVLIRLKEIQSCCYGNYSLRTNINS